MCGDDQRRRAQQDGAVSRRIRRPQLVITNAVDRRERGRVNTTGEYILGSIVEETASHAMASGEAGGLPDGQLIGDFYSSYFSLVNVLSLLLQLFADSRIVKYWGIPWAIMVLSPISLASYNSRVFYPVLYAVLGGKVLENSTDYSLNNTVRNMLFLPCTYEGKFSAKLGSQTLTVGGEAPANPRPPRLGREKVHASAPPSPERALAPILLPRHSHRMTVDPDFDFHHP